MENFSLWPVFVLQPRTTDALLYNSSLVLRIVSVVNVRSASFTSSRRSEGTSCTLGSWLGGIQHEARVCPHLAFLDVKFNISKCINAASRRSVEGAAENIRLWDFLCEMGLTSVSPSKSLVLCLWLFPAQLSSRLSGSGTRSRPSSSVLLML